MQDTALSFGRKLYAMGGPDAMVSPLVQKGQGRRFTRRVQSAAHADSVIEVHPILTFQDTPAEFSIAQLSLAIQALCWSSSFRLSYKIHADAR